jgi:hypothetical protein
MVGPIIALRTSPAAGAALEYALQSRRAAEPGSRRTGMPRYVIERDLPGAGKLSTDELRGVSQKSCDVLQQMGPQIQWVESYVTADKIYCVYVAPNEEMIRQHATKGGFPANKISEVKAVIGPTTAEGRA